MANLENLNELKSDLKELESILVHATRSNVRDILANGISSIKASIETMEQQQKNTETKVTSNVSAEQKPTLYTTKITNYATDESSKFYKLYLTIPDIEKLQQEQLDCQFTENSFKFLATNHLSKNHELKIARLAYNIKADESTCRLKSGNVIISLRKVDSKTWGCLTESERKEKDAKDSKLSDKADGMGEDPSAGIMNMMKKMYDEGDDDMKRMIKKTWYESQQKQGGGGGGGMPGMPGMAGMAGMPGMPVGDNQQEGGMIQDVLNHAFFVSIITLVFLL